MRVFTCLSRNISMAQENEERTKRRKHRLNFKHKKRRSNPYERRPVTPSLEQRKSFTQRSFQHNDENIPPASIYGGDILPPPPGSTSSTAGSCRRRSVCDNRLSVYSDSKAALLTHRDDQSMSKLSSNYRPISQAPSLKTFTGSKLPSRRKNSEPLPPIPKDTGASICIKELDTTQDAMDLDYLPLSQVCPPLQEDTCDEDADSDISVGHYEIPRWNPTSAEAASQPDNSNRLEPCSSNSGTTLSSESRTSVAISCDSVSQIISSISTASITTNQNPSSRSCSTTTVSSSSSNVIMSNMKTVGSLINKAFIESTGSLPHRTVSGASVNSLPTTSSVGTLTNLPSHTHSYDTSLGNSVSFVTISDNTVSEFNTQNYTSEFHTQNSITSDSTAFHTQTYDTTTNSTASFSHSDNLTLSDTTQPNCDKPIIRNVFTDLNDPTHMELCNPYTSTQVTVFKNNVIKTPDPYDTVEEEYMEEEVTQIVDVTGLDSDTVDNVSPSSSASEFLGCMSFGVQHLLNKDVDGWYYLLTEEIGRKKHLQAHTKPKPVLTTRSYQNIPQINKAVDGQERVIITIPRGKNGFGFSFVDELPPKVGRVDRASPAEQAGVKKGDLVIRINGHNVSRSTCEGVAHMVKKLNPPSLTLELQRDHVISTTTEVTAYGNQQPHHPSPYNKRGVGTSTDHLYESIHERPSGDQYKENRAVAAFDRSFEDEYVTDDETALMSQGASGQPGITSTPRPVLAPSHKACGSQPSQAMSKHESIHRLMSLELDYIDFMHYGIERYSRPLRHCIVSAHQHMTLFQNVEKVVTISEYHIKQMQDNNSSVNSDTDDSQSSESSIFPNSVSLIYQSKIHMLCQAYETYANGLVRSNALLKELRRNRDFMSFIREPASAEGQSLGHPSISAFINRPVQHIQELHTVLTEIFSATPLHSPDFASLQQIIIKLSQCVSNITGLDSAGRVHSLDSLTSSQGRTSSQTTSSGKGSMASLSSTCSSSEADLQRPLMPNSAASIRSIDRDVVRIQDRLVFSPNVQAFQLCQEERHLIYRGDIYRCKKGSWYKSQLLLFSDLLLMVEEEADGSLVVSDSPVSIQDLAGIEMNRKYASEFVLHLYPTQSSSQGRRQPASVAAGAGGSLRALVLRAPSSQEKFVWKSLLEQRVAAIGGGRLQHYGSMKDISNVKTSIIL